MAEIFPVQIETILELSDMSESEDCDTGLDCLVYKNVIFFFVCKIV